MDKINLSSLDKACELCYVAKKYMLPHLVKECIGYLWSAVQPKNVCQIYEFARLLQENVLMEKCLQVISLNTKEVLTDSSFEEVDLDTMITVFSLEHLNVDSELDLFEAVTRFAKPLGKRQAELPSNEKVLNVDSSLEALFPILSGSDARPENSKKLTIRSAIEQIRFLTLSPQQFAEVPVLRPPLLTESEAFAVLMNISSSRSDVPLPRGFSTSREPRKHLIGNGPNVRQISVSKSFFDFISQEFRSRNMELMAPPLESGLKLIPFLTLGPRPVQINCSCSYENFTRFNTYRSEIHYFCYCPRFTTERLGFEVVCRAYKVDPFSEDIKKHKETVKALDVFFDQIKTKSR
ncbi:BTB/POZ domain-containing protein 6-like isoform X2 [Choristoneura fumiferana]